MKSLNCSLECPFLELFLFFKSCKGSEMKTHGSLDFSSVSVSSVSAVDLAECRCCWSEQIA